MVKVVAARMIRWAAHVPPATRTRPEDDMLPTEQARKKAREILETLRGKANERGLTDQEKAYIDRLLRGLY